MNLISQARELVMINNEQTEVDTATFLISSQGGSNPDGSIDATYQVYGTGGNNGTAHNVYIKVKRPYVTYSQRLVGYIPRAQFSVPMDVCIGDERTVDEDAELVALFGPDVLQARKGWVIALQQASEGNCRVYDYLTKKCRSYYEFAKWTVAHLQSNTTPNPKHPQAISLMSGGAASTVNLVAKTSKWQKGFNILSAANSVGLLYAFYQIGALRSEVQELAQRVTVLFEQVSGIIQEQNKFNAMSIQLDKKIISNQAIQNSVNENLQTQIDRNTENIELLNKQQVTQSKNLQSLQDGVAKDFLEVRKALNETTVADNALRNLVLQLYDGTQGQFERLVRAIRASVIDQGNVNAQLLRLYRGSEKRRAFIATYFNALNDITYPYADMSIVAQNRGREPLSWQARQNIRNVAGSQRVALARWSYSDSTKGYTTTFELKCDKEWMLNNTGAYSSIYSIINSLGPNPTGSTEECECCNDVDAWGAWSCQCIVVVQKKSCTLANAANKWPWDFDTYPDLCVDVANCTGVCNEGIGVATDTTYYSNITMLETLFNTECSNALIVDSTAVNTTGDNVRITMEGANRYMNFNLSSSVPIRALQCESNYEQMQATTGLDVTTNLIWATWQFMTVSVAAYSATLRGTWESELFGILPSDITSFESVTSPYPSLRECHYAARLHAAFATTGDYAKLPVYLMEPGDLVHEVWVKLGDSGTYKEFQTTTGVGTSAMPNTFAEGVTGNYTVTTDLLFSSTSESALPKRAFYRVGYYGGYYFSDATEATINTPGLATLAGRADPYNPNYIYDVPFEQLPFGRTSASAENTVKYLFEPLSKAYYNDTTSATEINATRWRVLNERTYNAAAAGESASFYLREGKWQAGTYTCNRYFDYNTLGVNDYFLSEYVGESYEWCSLLDRFRAIEATDRSYMRMEYLEYAELVRLRVPAGTFTSRVLTGCPDSYNITRDIQGSNSVTIVLNTLASSVVKWAVQIRNTVTNAVYVSLTAQASKLSPWTYVLNTAGNYTVQVYPLNDYSAKCFSGEGLSLSLTHYGSGSANMPFTQQQFIQYAQDNAIISAYGAISTALEAAADVQVAVYSTALEDTLDIQAVLDASIAKIRASVANITATAELKALMDANVEQSVATMRLVAQFAELNRNASIQNRQWFLEQQQNVNASLELIQNLTAQNELLKNLSAEFTANVADFREFADSIAGGSFADFIKSVADGAAYLVFKSVDKLSKLQDLFDMIALPDGLLGPFFAILMFIVFAFVAVIGVYIAYKLYQYYKKRKAKNGGYSRASAHDEDDEGPNPRNDNRYTSRGLQRRK